MEDKELTVKIELAKSWFVLAQMSLIIGGFMFTLCGVFYSNLQSTQLETTIAANNWIYNFQVNNQTIPNYIKDNPQLKISILNLDTDIYEPALCILEYLWDKIVKGGILILDDYGVFPGETKAVDEFFNNKIKINKIPFSTPFSYIIKE